MTVRGVLVDGDGLGWGPSVLRHLDDVAARRPIAIARSTSEDLPAELITRFGFVLDADRLGLDRRDPRILTMAAAGFACHPNELAAVGTDPRGDVALVRTVGGRGIWLRSAADAEAPRGVHPDAVIDDLHELTAVLDRFDEDEAREAARVGVGPHPRPWPDGDHLDPELLARGDRRNVVDRYRYWKEEAIAAALVAEARPFHVAVENWRRDRNIGTVVRNANGFGAAGVHLIGPRRWNRRGAMATDRYLALEQHVDVETFVDRVRAEGLTIVAVDNVEGSTPIETTRLPRRCVLVFGQEGPGLTTALLDRADHLVHITQRGSTRSLNAGVAAGIAMYAWSLQHPVGREPASVPTV